MGFLFCTKPYFASGAAGVWQAVKQMPIGTRFSTVFYAHNKIFVFATKSNTIIYNPLSVLYNVVEDSHRGVQFNVNGLFCIRGGLEGVYHLYGYGTGSYRAETERSNMVLLDEYEDKRFSYGYSSVKGAYLGDCGSCLHVGKYDVYNALIFGGRYEDMRSISDRILMFDTQRTGLHYKASFSTPLLYLSATECSGAYYAAGGINGSTVFSQLIKYTEQTNTVEYFDMPAALAGCCLVGHAGKVYVFGGATNANFTGVVNTVYAFDVVSKTWETLPPMPTAVANAGGCALPDRNEIHIFGGWNGNTMLNTHQILKLS